MSRIVGLGLDVVDLGRLGRLLDRHGEAFERRFVLPGEARPVVGSARVAHLGGLFAAKEAALKALGTGWAGGLGLTQIEVTRESSGRPGLRFHGAAARRALLLGVEQERISITHDRGVAAAVVILEGSPGEGVEE